jgi:hypothetical protein
MSTIAMFLPFLCRPTADRSIAPISEDGLDLGLIL